MELGTLISIVGTIISVGAVVISLIALLLNRKDKSNKDTKDDGYKWGQLEEKLAHISKTLEKIENKLDTYDREIDEKIEKAMENHILTYHKRSKKGEL